MGAENYSEDSRMAAVARVEKVFNRRAVRLWVLRPLIESRILGVSVTIRHICIAIIGR